MQFLKKIILSTVSVFSVSMALFLTSCAPKNSCDTLVCKNGGTCAADFCNCPTGFDGPECQNRITDRYIGTYAGFTDPRNGQPPKLDTVDVYTSSSPMTLSVVRRKRYDAVYTGILDNKNNTIIINDVVTQAMTSIVNVTIKAPTSVSPKRTINLNVEDYVNGVRTERLEFNGELVAQ